MSRFERYSKFRVKCPTADWGEGVGYPMGLRGRPKGGYNTCGPCKNCLTTGSQVLLLRRLMNGGLREPYPRRTLNRQFGLVKTRERCRVRLFTSSRERDRCGVRSRSGTRLLWRRFAPTARTSAVRVTVSTLFSLSLHQPPALLLTDQRGFLLDFVARYCGSNTHTGQTHLTAKHAKGGTPRRQGQSNITAPEGGNRSIFTSTILGDLAFLAILAVHRRSS